MAKNQRLSFGKALREARLSRDLTQAAMAALAGVAETHLSEIENGHQNLTFETAAIIASVLGMEFTVGLTPATKSKRR